MKIREAQVKDREAISDLYYQLYPRHKGPKKLLPIKNFQARSLLFVAEEDKRVLGFIWGTFINYGTSRYGYIEELFVRKELRRKGIASALLQALLSEFRKLKVWALFVSVGRKDEVALRLYRKFGLRICKGFWLYLELEKEKADNL